MNKNQTLGLIRHVLTLIAGFLIAKGKLEVAASETIIGSALALAGSIWSVFSPEKQA